MKNFLSRWLENVGRIFRSRKQLCWLIIIFFIFSLFNSAYAQDQTVGLFQNDKGSLDGYTLFAPFKFTTTYLIDNEGRLVNSWKSDFTPGSSAYLLETGNLLRGAQVHNEKFAGGAGGRVEEFDWDGKLVWNFEYSNDKHKSHHDIARLPNGNILMIAWEVKNRVEVIAAGRDTTLLREGELWPDHIIEVQPTGLVGGKIVWEWHVWDHLIQDFDSTKANYGVVADHAELVDLNLVYDDRADWLHFNAIAYNRDLDQIIVSTPFLCGIWVLDHSTTTEEAAGHTGGDSGKGGDILYRWGNPETYDAGISMDKKLFFQHDVQWIESGLPGEGNILVFNNGRDRPDGAYSSIDEWEPPIQADGNYFRMSGNAYGPEQLLWQYTADNKTDFYSPFISGAQRLSNGNTLICSGMNGAFFEVTAEGETVWKYVNPVTDIGPIAQSDSIPLENGFGTNLVFRALRYAPSFPGLADRELTPGDPIELPLISSIAGPNDEIPAQFALHQNYPNPFNAVTNIKFSLSEAAKVSLNIYNISGQEVVFLLNNQRFNAGDHTFSVDATNLSSGVYLYRLRSANFVFTRKMMVIK